ncbi:MAG: hypothetical protein OXI63_14210 [Candidatus Poribacteria bacterium]|nr:hypothetical protein [Candidatus Poribacteria bacterium]
MLICRYIALVLLFLIFGCNGKFTKEELDTAVTNATKDMYTRRQVNTEVANATKNMYTQDQVEAKVANATKDMYTRRQVNTEVANATKDMYTRRQVNTEVANATKDMYTRRQVNTEVANATKNMVSEANYNSVRDRLNEAEVKVATSKAEQTIKLAKQINFFGFDEEAGSIPGEVASHLNAAKRELKQAEQKLKNRYQAEESEKHAAKAFKMRTEIVYYSLIRYHYRLGEKYKERGEREEKQDAYQEAYEIAKQLFENGTRINSQYPLFNDIAYRLAKMGLDFYEDQRITPAEEIYELIKKYRWREGRVQKLISDLREKVGD